MSLLSAAILGIVQALTEFLPVSSTAHLLVFGELLGQHLGDDKFRAFVTIIQTGTTLAVLVYFRVELGRLLGAGLGSLRGLRPGEILRLFTGDPGALRRILPLESPDARLAWYIVLGTVPAAALGKLLEKRIEALGNIVIAGSLVALGLALLAAERLASHRRDVEDVTALQALLVGCGQALALVPGCSRSGTTITAGMMLGLKREAAARFSFLLSVPIILGAGAYKLVKSVPALRGDLPWTLATLIGTAVAAVGGYLVIGWLLGWLRTRTTYVFVAWRIAAGVVIAVLIWRGVLPARDEDRPPPGAVSLAP
jgi:undecaprenyl-diphosphatase